MEGSGETGNAWRGNAVVGRGRREKGENRGERGKGLQRDRGQGEAHTLMPLASALTLSIDSPHPSRLSSLPSLTYSPSPLTRLHSLSQLPIIPPASPLLSLRSPPLLPPPPYSSLLTGPVGKLRVIATLQYTSPPPPHAPHPPWRGGVGGVRIGRDI